MADTPPRITVPDNDDRLTLISVLSTYHVKLIKSTPQNRMQSSFKRDRLERVEALLVELGRGDFNNEDQ